MLDRIIQIASLVITLFGGGFLGHVISGRKYTNDDKQEIINQLQEERQYTNSQLQLRDEKIDELYKRFRDLEQKHSELAQEKREVEWQLKRKEAENQLLTEENERLYEENNELRLENGYMKQKLEGIKNGNNHE